jgi:hypothetical protein
MKRFLMVFLAMTWVIFGSYLYKHQHAGILDRFPIHKINSYSDSEKRIYLLLFFSYRNCQSCMEIVKILNELPDRFKVVGIVPQREYEDIEEVKKITGVMFEVMSLKKFRKYLPNYGPTIYGVTRRGDVLFILPAVPNENQYFEFFLNTLYEKVFPDL